MLHFCADEFQALMSVFPLVQDYATKFHAWVLTKWPRHAKHCYNHEHHKEGALEEYQAWGLIEDGLRGDMIFAPKSSIDNMLPMGLMTILGDAGDGSEDKPAVHLYSIMSSSYNDAMTEYHKCQGLEPYIPF